MTTEALRAAAPLAVHVAQLRRVNLAAAFGAGRKECGADLLGADFERRVISNPGSCEPKLPRAGPCKGRKDGAPNLSGIGIERSKAWAIRLLSSELGRFEQHQVYSLFRSRHGHLIGPWAVGLLHETSSLHRLTLKKAPAP